MVAFWCLWADPLFPISEKESVSLSSIQPMGHLILVHPQGPVIRQRQVRQVIGEDGIVQMEAVVAWAALELWKTHETRSTLSSLSWWRATCDQCSWGKSYPSYKFNLSWNMLLSQVIVWWPCLFRSKLSEFSPKGPTAIKTEHHLNKNETPMTHANHGNNKSKCNAYNYLHVSYGEVFLTPVPEHFVIPMKFPICQWGLPSHVQGGQTWDNWRQLIL